MQTDLEIAIAALRSIAESDPTTDEGEWMASAAREALDEIAARERSRGLPPAQPCA